MDAKKRLEALKQGFQPIFCISIEFKDRKVWFLWSCFSLCHYLSGDLLWCFPHCSEIQELQRKTQENVNNEKRRKRFFGLRRAQETLRLWLRSSCWCLSLKGNYVLVKPPRAHFPKSAVDRGSEEENYTFTRPPAVIFPLADANMHHTLSDLHPSLCPESRLAL